jgi:hypothetical protein
MKYETIADIYDGNAKVRERLKSLLSSLTPEQTSAEVEGEEWTIAQIVEHIAIVDAATLKICTKLLHKAEAAGQGSDGKATISSNFHEKGTEIATVKIQAPEFVRPTGEKSIADSVEQLDENFERAARLQTTFETVDGTTFKFPHPFFGDITAHEWLALKGGHELRHLKQIERLLGK